MAQRLGRQAPPPGWSVNPIQSAKFQARLLGKPAMYLEELSAAQIIKLIEATKSIYRRAARPALSKAEGNAECGTRSEPQKGVTHGEH
jgi:hypothetical protein